MFFQDLSKKKNQDHTANENKRNYWCTNLNDFIFYYVVAFTMLPERCLQAGFLLGAQVWRMVICRRSMQDQQSQVLY